MQAMTPDRVVVLAADDGAACVAMSQAARDMDTTITCISVDPRQEEATAEPGARGQTGAVSGDIGKHRDSNDLKARPLSEALAGTAEESVDILYLDGRDPAADLAAVFAPWRPRLSPTGVVLVHGTEATSGPTAARRFLDEISDGRACANFHHGQGLGVVLWGEKTAPKTAPTLAEFADLLTDARTRALVTGYFSAESAKLDAQREAQALAVRLNAALEDLHNARPETLPDIDKLQTIYDDFAKQVSELRDAAQASIKLLGKPVRSYLVARLARGVAKLPALSERRREKFLRSANKRDPKRAARLLSERLQGLQADLPPISLTATRFWGQDLDAVELEMVEHTQPVDIIVCVHNALDDVRACLSSIVAKTVPPYRLIIVDDGSGDETRQYLQDFALAQSATLLRNEVAGGYTRAANAGLKASDAPWAILLNSDVIVPFGWLDEMLKIGNSDARIGIVGPSSNTASWQSVPDLFLADGDWSDNPLPDGVSVDDMQRIVTRLAPRQGIDLPFLNGFAYMIRREVIDDIGIFDEEVFGAGYGEENDYCIRARDAGWKLVFAPNAYVFHAQSKSYSTERRLKLAQAADQNLQRKHDPDTKILPQVTWCRWNLAAAALRARVAVQMEDREKIARFTRTYTSKRVAFILPASQAGGGSNIVMQEASLLSDMGVDTWILNLKQNRQKFERNYRDARPTVLYFEDPREITSFLGANPLDFDAVVATAHFTVDWLPDAFENTAPRLGYYIQDFEADFYKKDDKNHAAALATYRKLDRIAGFTKTNWNADAVARVGTARPQVIGASVNLEDFRPKGRNVGSGAKIIVVAMVRFDANVKRRAPELTIRVLNRLARSYRDRVEVRIFGCNDEKRLKPLVDESIVNVGVLPPGDVAGLLRNADIFLDFSVWQAMGLSAMEAMACGCAVVVPENGGTTDFCRHEKNALVIDTGDEETCYAAAARLVEDATLRSELSRNATTDICAFTQERAAMRMVEALFEEPA